MNVRGLAGAYAACGLAAMSLVARGDGLAHGASAQDEYVVPSSPLIRKRIEWFRDQKLGLMIHFGLYSILGITESWPLSTVDGYWARADVEWTKDDAEFKRQYFALNRSFNPIRFDAEAWAKLARRSGFRYVTFTTKHHDGFCLWDTQYTDYKTTDASCPYSVNANADIVRRLFDACRREGLGVSAYFSKPDFHHEDFWEDHGIGRVTSRYATYDPRTNPDKWNRFHAFVKNQILELVGNYGPIEILWMDGSWLRASRGCDLRMGEIVDAARKIQPGLISVDRAMKDEYMNIRTPEQCVPDVPLPYPWESSITMSDGWGYHFDDHYKSARELIHLLVGVVAKGGNLALNVGPMPDGRFPRPAVERLETIGRWLAKNGEAIYGTRETEPYSLGSWCFTKAKDGRTFAIRLWRPGDGKPGCVPLEIAKGQPEIAEIVHLASGRRMSFEAWKGDHARGVRIDIPDDFEFDEYADAFEIRSCIPKQGAVE